MATTGHVADRHHPQAPCGGDAREPGTHVAEALHGDAPRREVPAATFGVDLEHRETAPSRGRFTPGRAAQLDGLARNDRGREPVGGAIRVHHPGHDLGVGAHVGCRDVAVGAQHVLDALGEAPGQSLELRSRQGCGIHGDAALGPAEGHVDQCRLPGHQRGQRSHLVEIGAGVEAHPSLVGTPRPVVLNPVATHDHEVAVVEANRDLHGDLSVARREHLVHLLVDAGQVSGLLEVLDDRLVGRGCRHRERFSPLRSPVASPGVPRRLPPAP